MTKREKIEAWVFVILLLYFVMWALLPCFSAEPTESIELINPVEQAVLTMRLQISDMQKEIAELKKQTRPIINIKYGAVYHSDGEIVVEEQGKKESDAG